MVQVTKQEQELFPPVKWVWGKSAISFSSHSGAFSKPRKGRTGLCEQQTLELLVFSVLFFSPLPSCFRDDLCWLGLREESSSRQHGAGWSWTNKWRLHESLQSCPHAERPSSLINVTGANWRRICTAAAFLHLLCRANAQLFWARSESRPWKLYNNIISLFAAFSAGNYCSSVCTAAAGRLLSTRPSFQLTE